MTKHRVDNIKERVEAWLVVGDDPTEAELRDLAAGHNEEVRHSRKFIKELHKGGVELGLAEFSVLSHSSVQMSGDSSYQQMVERAGCVPFSVVLQPKDSAGKDLNGKLIACGIFSRGQGFQVFRIDRAD